MLPTDGRPADQQQADGGGREGGSGEDDQRIHGGEVGAEVKREKERVTQSSIASYVPCELNRT